MMKRESLYNMNCFEVLGISPTKDRKTIRHAYAIQAKKYNLETDTDKVEQLKDAYEKCMSYAKESAGESENNVIETVYLHEYTDDMAGTDNVISDEIVISPYTDIYTDGGKQKGTGRFFESESLWENYGKLQYEKIKELPGLQKIEKEIEDGHIFSFNESRTYVISPEFLNNQYKEVYMHRLLELFEKYLDILKTHFGRENRNISEEAFGKFFLPFACMYGWNETFDGKNLFGKFSDILENSWILNKAEVTAFSVNAKRYYELAMAYKDDDKEKQDFFWSSLWQYGLDHDELPVVKVKNDFSFWKMLTVFLETHKDVDFRAYIELEKQFDLSARKKSSKKHIFQPIIDIMEKNTGFTIETINIWVMLIKGNYITGLREKANLSSYLKENKLNYSIFKFLYELYYYVSDPTEEEQTVMEMLQEYGEYEKYYWQQAERELEKEEDIEMVHAFLKIVECVTDGHRELMEEMEACISDTQKYYKKHLEEFEERSMGEIEVQEEDIEEDEIQWIAMVDILEKSGYAAECDWCEEKEDFLYNIRNLNKIKSKNLEIDDSWLDEEGEIPEWLEIIDEKWAEKGMSMLAFDIDSDSYVLFPCETEKFLQLEEWAKEEGYRIAYGREM